MGFDSRAQDVRSAAGIASADWVGAAQSAFATYAGHLSSTFSSNSQVLGRASQLLSSLARELEQAQQITRQAASECERYQGQLTAQQTLAEQHGGNAQTLYAQASAAVHPQMQGALRDQADREAGLARQASQAATQAKGEFDFWQKRGQDTERTYTEQAQAAAQQITGLQGELRAPAALPGGGATVPISVSPADMNFARGMLPAIMGVPASAWGENPGEELAALNGGRPLTPSQVLAVYEVAKAQQSNGRGSIIDGLGGLVSTATGGLVTFGNPNTARFHGGEIAGVIVTGGVDPEALAVDGERVTMGVVEDGSTAIQDIKGADQVIPYGEQPSPRPPGTQAHHIFQQAALRDVPGYSSRDAPSILLPQADHLQATAFQREAVIGGTVQAERTVAIQALIRAGVSPADAQKIVDEAQKYPLDTLGLKPDSPVRVPRRPNLKP